MVLPVFLSDIGAEATGRFSYTVQSFDLDDELRFVAADDTPIVPFDALAPSIAADPAWTSIAGSDTVNVKINRAPLAANPSDGLLILEPNDEPGTSQWETVKVTAR